MTLNNHFVKSRRWRPMRSILCGLWLSSALLLGAATTEAIESHPQAMLRAQWPTDANGQNILALPVVQHTLRRFAENSNISIIIRYPGGEAGRQWADQMSNWLVSFGVPSEYLDLQVGTGAADRLVLEVIDHTFR